MLPNFNLMEPQGGNKPSNLTGMYMSNKHLLCYSFLNFSSYTICKYHGHWAMKLVSQLSSSVILIIDDNKSQYNNNGSLILSVTTLSLTINWIRYWESQIQSQIVVICDLSCNLNCWKLMVCFKIKINWKLTEELLRIRAQVEHNLLWNKN